MWRNGVIAMANTNLAVAVNNMIFCAAAPTLPSQELLDKLNVTSSDVTAVVDNIVEVMDNMNESRKVYLEYIGELDFFNEVTGLASHCAKNGRYTYDFRQNASTFEYPSFSNVILCKGDAISYIDIIIDANEMNVYRVHSR